MQSRFWRSAWPSLRLGLILIAGVLLPGLVLGESPTAAAGVFAFLVAWVLLPGMACALVLRDEEREPLLLLGLGLALGLVLAGAVQLLCRATGNYLLLYAWPLVTLLGAHLHTPAAAPRDEQRSTRGAWLFALVLLVVLLRAPAIHADPSRWDSWADLDFLFHVGSAAELKRSGPLLDPRVAGYVLNYHLFGHTLLAGASLVTGLGVSEVYGTWLPAFHPALLALLVFSLASRIGGSPVAGFVAALGLMLHGDAGEGLLGLGLTSGRGSGFKSSLDLSLYRSLTTACGLLFLVAMACTLPRCLAPGRTRWRAWVQLALLALGASLAKGTVMSIAIPAAAIAAVLESLRQRRWERRWLAIAATFLFVALPGSLYLSLGPGSFAGAFKPGPFEVVLSSPSISSWTAAVGFDPTSAWTGLLFLPVWFFFQLGSASIGSVAWLAASRPGLLGLGPWIVGLLCTGLPPALWLWAGGDSQLFFLQNAEVLLFVVGGVGAAALWRVRPRLTLALGVSTLPFLLFGLGSLYALRYRGGRSPCDVSPSWVEGAHWLRRHAEPGALLVASDRSAPLAVVAERRAFLERPFRPEFWAANWQRIDGRWTTVQMTEHPYPEHLAASQQAFAVGDAEALARVRALAGHAGPLYLVSSPSPASPEGAAAAARSARAALENAGLVERCFGNEDVVVYRAKD